jgi:hypothetical protein
MASQVLDLFTADQVLRAVGRLERRSPLTYRQLRDLEARQCVAPRVLPGGKGPRVYDLADVLLLRLVARMQADELIARWQAWAVVAQLRNELRAVLRGTLPRVLVVQGAIGRLVPPKQAEHISGVPFDLADIGRGVTDALRSVRSALVWNGWAWVSPADAAASVRSFMEVRAGK